MKRCGEHWTRNCWEHFKKGQAVHFFIDMEQKYCQLEVISRGTVLSTVKDYYNICDRKMECFICMEGSAVRVLIDGQAAMTGRCFLQRDGHLFLYAEEGNLKIRKVRKKI